MDGTSEKHGGGIDNVLEGVFVNFPKHVWQWVTGSDSGLAQFLKAPLEELVAYEKVHGKEQLDAIVQAGLAAYSSALSAGLHKTPALGKAVEAAFESGIAEVKSLSTLAMNFLLAAAAKAVA